MASIVAHKRIQAPSRRTVKGAFDQLAGLAPLAPGSLGRKCLIKINAMSREVLPGRNTSPWVLEAVVEHLRENHPGVDLVIADTDVAGSHQFETACRRWGYERIAREHGVEILNLAREPVVEVESGSPICPTLCLPLVVAEVDSILNLPVIKTHVITGITCCLKNHWGLLPRMRYNYHPWATEVIAVLNRQITKTVYNVVDGTVCMEGSGPKTGDPKVCSVMFSGRDRVAVDRAVLDFMALPLDLAPHVAMSAELGVGEIEYVIAGDEMIPQPFAPPALSNDVVSWLENRLRRIPRLGSLFYHPWLAPVLGLVGTMYNELVWFQFKGRPHLEKFLLESPYRDEFERLIM